MNNAGSQISGFLGGILNPFASAANTLAGSTTTTQTVGPGAASQSNSHTVVIVVAVLAVVVLAGITYVLIKKSN